MPSAKQPHIRLGHILEEIDAIVAATAGMSAADVGNDDRTIRAMERAIQIISEAA